MVALGGLVSDHLERCSTPVASHSDADTDVLALDRVGAPPGRGRAIPAACPGSILGPKQDLPDILNERSK